jgi:DNA-directed RNA polymerase subunit P
MVDEIDSESNDTESISDVADDEKFDVVYSCLRCATKVSSSELNRLPEIKCICGFRVFTKVRPPIVKTVKAV